MAKQKGGYSEVMFKGTHWTAFRILPGARGSNRVATYEARGNTHYWEAEDFFNRHGDDYAFEASADHELHSESVNSADAVKAMMQWRREAYAEGFTQRRQEL